MGTVYERGIHMNQVRQGDVFLVRITAAEAKGLAGQTEAAPKDARGIVLAEGETSGHHHQLFGNGAKLAKFRDAGGMNIHLLTVGKGGGELRVVGGETRAKNGDIVPRHVPVALKAGHYVQRVQRSYTSAMASRRVVD